MRFEELVMKKPEEIDEMADSGMFNSIIKGYAIYAMLEAGVSEEAIRKVPFNSMFDEISASDARSKARKY